MMTNERMKFVKSVIEKHQGNRKKSALELKVSATYVSKMAAMIGEKYLSWPYSKKNQCWFDKIFPTNEERIRYKDHPEKRTSRSKYC